MRDCEVTSDVSSKETDCVLLSDVTDDAPLADKDREPAPSPTPPQTPPSGKSGKSEKGDQPERRTSATTPLQDFMTENVKEARDSLELRNNVQWAAIWISVDATSTTFPYTPGSPGAPDHIEHPGTYPCGPPYAGPIESSQENYLVARIYNEGSYTQRRYKHAEAIIKWQVRAPDPELFSTRNLGKRKTTTTRRLKHWFRLTWGRLDSWEYLATPQYEMPARNLPVKNDHPRQKEIAR